MDIGWLEVKVVMSGGTHFIFEEEEYLWRDGYQMQRGEAFKKIWDSSNREGKQELQTQMSFKTIHLRLHV